MNEELKLKMVNDLHKITKLIRGRVEIGAHILNHNLSRLWSLDFRD